MKNYKILSRVMLVLLMVTRFFIFIKLKNLDYNYFCGIIRTTKEKMG